MRLTRRPASTRDSGFTLVELLASMVVMVILLSIAVGAFMWARRDASAATVMNGLNAVSSSLLTHSQTYYTLPTADPDPVTGWTPPPLTNGHTYQVCYPAGGGGEFLIFGQAGSGSGMRPVFAFWSERGILRGESEVASLDCSSTAAAMGLTNVDGVNLTTYTTVGPTLIGTAGI